MNTNDKQATPAVMTVDQPQPDSMLVQLVPNNWEECIDLLLAAHVHGTGTGRALARANFTHLARLADLSADVLSHLRTCPAISDQAWTTKCQELIGRANALWHAAPSTDLQAYEGGEPSTNSPDEQTADAGEPVVDKQLATCRPDVQHGKLAAAAGRPDLELQVLYSAAGFYIGTWSEAGPYTRESREYWPRRTQAEKALKNRDWTQRDYL